MAGDLSHTDSGNKDLKSAKLASYGHQTLRYRQDDVKVRLAVYSLDSLALVVALVLSRMASLD